MDSLMVCAFPEDQDRALLVRTLKIKANVDAMTVVQ